MKTNEQVLREALQDILMEHANDNIRPKAFYIASKALAVAPVAATQPAAFGAAESVVAGALFDLMGHLTSRDERITLSGRDDAGVAVEVMTAWAKARNLNLEEANVKNWRHDLSATQPSEVQPATIAILQRAQFAIQTARKHIIGSNITAAEDQELIDTFHALRRASEGSSAEGAEPVKATVSLPAAEWSDMEFWLDRCEDKGHLENCPDLVEPWSDLKAAIAALQATKEG